MRNFSLCYKSGLKALGVGSGQVFLLLLHYAMVELRSFLRCCITYCNTLHIFSDKGSVDLIMLGIPVMCCDCHLDLPFPPFSSLIFLLHWK